MYVVRAPSPILPRTLPLWSHWALGISTHDPPCKQLLAGEGQVLGIPGPVGVSWVVLILFWWGGGLCGHCGHVTCRVVPRCHQ